MRVLQVITSLLTGGAEHIVVELSERLTARGIHCDICVFDGEDTPFMHEIAEWNKLHTDCEPIRIIRLGHGFYSPLYVLKLARLMRRYDIVHTHNSSPQLYAAFARTLIVGKKPKLCTTEHSTENRKRSSRWLRLVDRWMYSRYGKVVCISNIAEEKLRGYLGGKWLDKTSNCFQHITTINNGIDVEAFHNAEPAADLIKLKGDRKAIVMVAGFREAKDQDALVRAMKFFDPKKFELWLVGIGERMDEVKELADFVCVTDRVRFLGLRMDVKNVLRAADFVVMSSHWEGLSLSNVEGMSVGKPFLASDVNGLREVTEGYGITFMEGDSAGIYRAITVLNDNPDFYRRIADQCYRRALQYDINKTVDGYVSVFTSL